MADPSGFSRDADLEQLEAEARYRRQRLDLYRAKAYGSGLTTAAGLRERERASVRADERLHDARARQVADKQVEEG
jgi:hypothetical protein